ncbi:hypothetical protein IWX90DRAFT_257873 [Phyllosticta citrichinensis]|uniref:Uncharacterized protein n=1 Tax=Phyllosticta citrichinensis TaxID=1130410 RepID=A0ABR1XS79_9PEZI
MYAAGNQPFSQSASASQQSPQSDKQTWPQDLDAHRMPQITLPASTPLALFHKMSRMSRPRPPTDHASCDLGAESCHQHHLALCIAHSTPRRRHPQVLQRFRLPSSIPSAGKSETRRTVVRGVHPIKCPRSVRTFTPAVASGCLYACLTVPPQVVQSLRQPRQPHTLPVVSFSFSQTMTAHAIHLDNHPANQSPDLAFAQPRSGMRHLGTKDLAPSGRPPYEEELMRDTDDARKRSD